MTGSTKDWEEKEKARRQVEASCSNLDVIQWLESFRSRGSLLLRSLAQSKRVYTSIVAMQHSVHLPFTFSRSPRRGLHNTEVLHNARGTLVERSVRWDEDKDKAKFIRGSSRFLSRVAIPRVAQHPYPYYMEFSFHETSYRVRFVPLNLNSLLLNTYISTSFLSFFFLCNNICMWFLHNTLTISD